MPRGLIECFSSLSFRGPYVHLAMENIDEQGHTGQGIIIVDHLVTLKLFVEKVYTSLSPETGHPGKRLSASFRSTLSMHCAHICRCVGFPRRFWLGWALHAHCFNAVPGGL